jgi:hypothetical protein
MNDDYCKWVALQRGVNVGRANKGPMADLRALAEGGLAGQSCLAICTARGGAIKIIDQEGSGFGGANDGPQPQHPAQARGNGALTVGVVGRYAGRMKSICIIACIITC